MRVLFLPDISIGPIAHCTFTSVCSLLFYILPEAITETFLISLFLLLAILGGFLLTKAWLILRSRIEEAASRYGR
jgi:hypothetical protein